MCPHTLCWQRATTGPWSCLFAMFPGHCAKQDKGRRPTYWTEYLLLCNPCGGKIVLFIQENILPLIVKGYLWKLLGLLASLNLQQLTAHFRGEEKNILSTASASSVSCCSVFCSYVCILTDSIYMSAGIFLCRTIICEFVQKYLITIFSICPESIFNFNLISAFCSVLGTLLTYIQLVKL